MIEPKKPCAVQPLPPPACGSGPLARADGLRRVPYRQAGSWHLTSATYTGLCPLERHDVGARRPRRAPVGGPGFAIRHELQVIRGTPACSPGDLAQQSFGVASGHNLSGATIAVDRA